jgi:hypothetical protein
VHAAIGRLVVIIMTNHVKQAVQRIEDEFAGTIVFERFGSTLGLIETAGDIGVDRRTGYGHGKAQDVGGRGIVVPALVQQAHPLIIHDLDGETDARHPELLDEPAQSVLNQFEFIGSKSTGTVVDLELITARRLVGLRRFRRFTPGGVTIGDDF